MPASILGRGSRQGVTTAAVVTGMPWKGPCPGPWLQPGTFPAVQSSSWSVQSPLQKYWAVLSTLCWLGDAG